MVSSRPPPISRRLLIVFSGVMLVVTCELGWWVFFQVRTSGEYVAAHSQLLGSERVTAAHMIALAARAQGALPELPELLLQQNFSDLEWRGGVESDPVLEPFYPRHQVQVRPAAVESISRQHRARMRMFLSEGSFFLLMVLLGGLLIVRTLRHEMQLIRQQANFLSAVTHELKSPLASIRLYTETMQLRDPPLETRSRYLGLMVEDIARLDVLVTNLLAVARLDAGQIIVHPQTIDLTREVPELVAGLQREWRLANIDVQLPQAPALVQVDPGALNTVLRNLLDNAIKYGNGRPVAVRLAVDGREAVLSVMDQGIGMAARELGKVFQKFYRVGDEMVRQTKGSGLGLYLVAALTQQHGGSVVARSAGPSLGSTLEVRLPLQPPDVV